jgi:CBS domain-containing protein
MSIKEIMTEHVEAVAYDATIKQAADRMRVLNVGCLPVKSDGAVSGIVTDRDITVRAIAQGLNPNETKVEEVMSTEIVWCYEDEDVQKAADLMKEKKVRRLLVRDHKDEVIGIVTIGDICVHCNPEFSGNVVKEISDPAEPNR